MRITGLTVICLGVGATLIAVAPLGARAQDHPADGPSSATASSTGIWNARSMADRTPIGTRVSGTATTGGLA